MTIKKILNKKAATQSLFGLGKTHQQGTVGANTNAVYSIDAAISDLQTIFSDPLSTQDEKQVAKRLIDTYRDIQWQIIHS